MASREDQWKALWKAEKTTCHEYTGHRAIMDWSGYGDKQEQRRKDAWHWISDRIEEIRAGKHHDDDEGQDKMRIEYMQAVLDGYSHYWWDVPAYPRDKATDDESCKIKERTYYCSFFDEGKKTQGQDAPYEDQQKRKRGNYDWLVDRRKWIKDCVDGKIDGQPPGWDVKARRQRYDNMNIALHDGDQWDQWKAGKYVPRDERPDDSDTRHRLSDHFVIEEFDCHDGTKCGSREYDGLESLCKVFLEPLRKEFGSVHINSGFRTPSYNASVGGATGSYHIYTQGDGNDQAADVTCASGSPSQWHSFLKKIRSEKRGGNGGLGLYSTFVHVDIRDYQSDWTG